MRFIGSKIFSALALAALLSAVSLGQRPAALSNSSSANEAKKEPCKLNASSLPPIARLRLRASYDEALQIYPEMAVDRHFQERLSESGSGFAQIRSQRLFDESANGRSSDVGLYFKDRFLSVISDGSGTNQYQTLQDALADYSRILKIDENLWTLFGTSASLMCTDFSFNVNSYGADGSDKYVVFNMHSLPSNQIDPQ